MSKFFLSAVNMSISASWIVLIVLLFRIIFKKAPKWINVLLWGIVAIRLICPIDIQSDVSLIPSSEIISTNVLSEEPEIDTGISIINNAINQKFDEKTVTVSPEKSINAFKFSVLIFSKLWITGVVVMLFYIIISYFKIKKKIGTAVLLKDNIFQSENVQSPFILGIIKPKIYLPFNLNNHDIENIIAHETTHIHRKDHLWKPLGFVILSFHWFNPLIWLGYILLCRDIELACDEKVIKELTAEQKADYSQTLLDCSIRRRTVAVCPLAFGETDVKKRIKSVLTYKKPAFCIIIVAIILTVFIATCFLTNPRTKLNDELSVFIDMQVSEHNYSEHHTDNNFIAVHHKILKVKNSLNTSTVYFWSLYHEYSYKNGEIKLESGSHIPTVITAKRTGKHRHYKLVEYWTPRDGSYYAKDIKDKFPWYLHSKALDTERYIDEQLEFCDNAAKEYFKKYYSASEIGGADEPQNVTVTPEISRLSKEISSVLNQKYQADKPDGLIHVENYCILASASASGTPLADKTNHMEKVSVYLLVYHTKYSINADRLEEVEGVFVPTAITFQIDKNSNYILDEYWTSHSKQEIYKKFPKKSANEVLNQEKYAENLIKENWKIATERLNKQLQNKKVP